jgi:hypothetical protein
MQPGGYGDDQQSTRRSADISKRMGQVRGDIRKLRLIINAGPAVGANLKSAVYNKKRLCFRVTVCRCTLSRCAVTVQERENALGISAAGAEREKVAEKMNRTRRSRATGEVKGGKGGK